jgi:hypothetical protein
MRQGHVQTLDTAILGGLLGAPDICATLVIDGVAFFGDLPFGAMGFHLLLSSGRESATFLVGGDALGTTIKQNLLGKFTLFLLNFLNGRGECHDLGILFICIQPRTISKHVAIHFIQILNDVGKECDVLHDPLAFKLINKRQKFLGGRQVKSMEEICDETLVGIQMFPCLCMNFLEKVHHASCQKTDVILVGRPKLNCVEFLLKVKNLHDGLVLADIKHLPHQHQSTMNLVAHFLIKEREFVLVSKERLVGGGGEMILEDVKDQLINDPQLNLVAADEPFVVILVAVEGNHLALCWIWFERRTQEHGVIPVIPLRKLLALGGRHLCPWCD